MKKKNNCHVNEIKTKIKNVDSVIREINYEIESLIFVETTEKKFVITGIYIFNLFDYVALHFWFCVLCLGALTMI